MLEIVILLGVAAIVSVLTVTALDQADREARVARTLEILGRTGRAITEDNGMSFYERVGALPRLLSQLSNPIANGTPNSCTTGGNTTHSGGEPGLWALWGPFGSFHIDATIGLVTPMGIANNTMVRSPTNNAAGTLRIDFPSVDVQDVLILDRLADATTNGFGAGFIQWTNPAAADGTTAMRVYLPVDNTC